jgi:hypothetical protein
MIFTFQLQNNIKRYIFFAEDKEKAFEELKARLGKEAENWSLVSYCETNKFSLFLN